MISFLCQIPIVMVGFGFLLFEGDLSWRKVCLHAWTHFKSHRFRNNIVCYDQCGKLNKKYYMEVKKDNRNFKIIKINIGSSFLV